MGEEHYIHEKWRTTISVPMYPLFQFFMARGAFVQNALWFKVVLWSRELCFVLICSKRFVSRSYSILI